MMVNYPWINWPFPTVKGARQATGRKLRSKVRKREERKGDRRCNVARISIEWKLRGEQLVYYERERADVRMRALCGVIRKVS